MNQRVQALNLSDTRLGVRNEKAQRSKTARGLAMTALVGKISEGPDR